MEHEHSWICGFCDCGAYLVFDKSIEDLALGKVNG